MRNLEELRDKHKGQEIWIIGAGPSLDDFPQNFFDDKISIAIGGTFGAFPNFTYFAGGHAIWARLMLKNNPNMLKRCIFAWRMDRMKEEELGRYKAFPYVCGKLITGNNKGKFIKVLRPTIDAIVNRRGYRLPALGTFLHRVILIAFILGAKKITLTGCDQRCTRHKGHAQRKGMVDLPHYKEKPGFEYPIAEQKGFEVGRFAVKLLATELNRYGIEIKRYFYKTGYEKTLFEED